MAGAWYVQVVETAVDKKEAAQIFAHLKSQVDFKGGRVLAPSPSKPGWRVQTFHDDCGAECNWLPDGMRRVFVPVSQRRALGLRR